MPDIIGRYQIKEKLRGDDIASIYLAFDTDSKFDVTLKMFSHIHLDQPDSIEDFRIAGKKITRLKHEALIPLYDCSVYEDEPYFVMQYIPGISLQDRLINEGPISLSETSKILNRLSSALDSMHRKNMFHGDIKPENIIMGDDGLPYLSDFGIIHTFEQSQTASATTFVGTPDYMAPEQWGKKYYDSRTDVYQLGVLLFEMLTNKKPFEADNIVELRDKHLFETTPSVRDYNNKLPPACDRVLKRAMAKEPVNRFLTTSELASEFSSAMKIGRYQIIEVLGRGGMGTVFLAHDPRFDRTVALKVLPEQLSHDPEFRKRFEHEAKTIANLEHQAIVPVHDFGQHAGQLYLVMRFIPGGSLQARFQQKELFSPTEICEILNRIANALDLAHSQGIIHRDIKPGNVLLDNNGLAYLSDFGIARILEQSTTTSPGFTGTPAYMAPEQWRGDKLTHRTDIYQLGILLFEMLTGQRPFVTESLHVLINQHLSSPIPLIEEVKPGLTPLYNQFFERALSKDPSKRFESVGEMAKALNQCVTSPESIVTLESGIQEDSQETAEDAGISPYLLSIEENKPDDERLEPVKLEVTTKGRNKPPWLVGGIGSVVIIFSLLFLFFPWIFDGGIPRTSATSTFTPTIHIVADFNTPSSTNTISPTQTPTLSQTPTKTPTNTMTPSVTPTVSPSTISTASPTFTQTPNPPPGVLIILNAVNMRSGPGTNYDIIGLLRQNETALILGKTENDAWFNVETEDGTRGWIASSVSTIINATLTQLPLVVTIPPIPTSTPTLTPTNTPTPRIRPPTSTPTASSTPKID